MIFLYEDSPSRNSQQSSGGRSGGSEEAGGPEEAGGSEGSDRSGSVQMFESDDKSNASSTPLTKTFAVLQGNSKTVPNIIRPRPRGISAEKSQSPVLVKR